jgi:hypothetical protein
MNGFHSEHEPASVKLAQAAAEDDLARVTRFPGHGAIPDVELVTGSNVDQLAWACARQAGNAGREVIRGCAPAALWRLDFVVWFARGT